MMRGVVGFTFQITHLEGKFKMSQNRSASERERVIEALRQTHGDVAAIMVDLL